MRWVCHITIMSYDIITTANQIIVNILISVTRFQTVYMQVHVCSECSSSHCTLEMWHFWKKNVTCMLALFQVFENCKCSWWSVQECYCIPLLDKYQSTSIGWWHISDVLVNWFMVGIAFRLWWSPFINIKARPEWPITWPNSFLRLPL